ncbi:Ig-like domain-containing protein [Dyadobacter fanqingshengii]|uniref:Carboxypeptidase-like regulatory domain-containing protein n=1 Tax=Dyadobacter fanqingshengii TaxID=2906443 RepID=A0A9X1PAF2_9BACT|nr:Ig-like domain-containing protein [Dyadobacter fanqingshengii]MCF0039780.1 carboxypeptidase-like regulatory domain-containing protein [Dyadobacter fanqingshengii]USJ38457.1 carboxypeptidase-like regulatory domain-containing protein [Dyadobacter fanqingshengii]
MSQIIPTYPIFEGSQVLTSDQLNQLSAYLDQQNRLTRSKLIGIGIVCGLQIQPFPDGLKISKGLGITSEGFLIQIGTDFIGTHYRRYVIPEGVSYRPFESPNGLGVLVQDVELWEMLSEKPVDETGVKKLNNPTAFLTDKYVLLFIEIFDRDLKSCLGNACDDKGKDRIFSLRRLLVSQTDLDLILTRSANVSGSFSGAPNLKTFRLKKPLFSPADLESNQLQAFVKHYQDTILETIKPEFWENLKRGYSVFEPILGKSFGFNNPFDQAAIISKIAQVQISLNALAADIKGVQYLWDFFKELALAWEEFVEAGLSLWYSCPTDPSLFPLHMLLGKARPETENAEEFYKYRRGFVQPPIFNEQKLLKDVTAQRYRRLVLMIETLELEILNNPRPAEFPVKITPSKEKQGVLGQRSIPYYYNLKSKGTLGSWFSLEKTWMDAENKHLWSADRQEILSYDNQPDVPNPNGTFLESPLNYDLEAYPFLRIEGHLDQEIDQAKDEVEKLIRQFNLPIHLETLHLDAGGLLDVEHCGWNDLQEEYLHHRLQLIGLIRDIKEIINFLQEMNKKFIEKGRNELFEPELEKQVLEYFEEFNVWVESLNECLKDLIWEKFQTGYKKVLQTLLDILLIRMKLLDKIDFSKQDPDQDLELYNGLLTRVSPILYRILDLFYFTKIQRLYLSYLKRTEKLQNSRKFSEYLKQNPGLVHEAGVYRGGTFFLLYLQTTGKVIGDLSLAGSACTCDCDDPCRDSKWDILPPFARPDFAIAFRNKQIRIEVMINDRSPVERKYRVEPSSDRSVNGGEVKQDEDKSAFLYIPPKDFLGDDSFTYLLTDEESGLVDEGRVTIWVKNPESKTCYTAEILTCWGETNVNETLERRRISRENMTFEQRVQVLLNSLATSKGFTLDEIRSSVLEGNEERKQLLTCLGMNVENASRDQMEKTILDYQNSNCGVIETPSPAECTSRRVTGSVRDNKGNPIPAAAVIIKGTTIGTQTDLNGKFVINFPNPGVELTVAVVGFRQVVRRICSESTVTIVLNPLAIREIVVVGVKPVTLDKTILSEILAVKGVKIENLANITKDELIKLATEGKEEISFKPEELGGLKSDTLKLIAGTKSISVRSTDTKAILIGRILGN